MSGLEMWQRKSRDIGQNYPVPIQLVVYLSLGPGCITMPRGGLIVAAYGGPCNYTWRVYVSG